MNKVTPETAAKMMEIADRTTYHGRIAYLAIAFLQETGLGFSDLSRLRIRDVYQLGVVRISLQVDPDNERVMPLSDQARQMVVSILKAQGDQGLQTFPWSHLFRMPSGRPFGREELAKLFWFYREAAEMNQAS